MANVLSGEKRGQVVSCLVEGMSIRATVRVTGVAKNTIVKLLVDLGTACSAYQDATLRNLDCKVVECDEIWSFCYAKQKNVPEQFYDAPGCGDVWTWVAIDADTKLVPTWLVGERTNRDAYAFLSDLKGRLKGRVQLTTDGQRRHDLQLERAGDVGHWRARGAEEALAGFVEHGAAYGAAHGISYRAWRIVGVPAKDLKAAGIGR